MKTKITLQRYDREYNLLEEKEIQSRSWLLNLIKLLYLDHLGTSLAGVIDITNTARTLHATAVSDVRYIKSSLAMAGCGGGSYDIFCPGHIFPFDNWQHIYVISVVDAVHPGENVGIVIGTGVGAVAPLDYALGTKVAHGTGAGQMEHGGTEILIPTFADPNGSMVMRRYLRNNSGGNITVQEVGIYATGVKYGDDAHIWLFCVARDLTGGFAVADTEILRVTYTVQITV
jgi:hypothetical protein